MRPGEQSRHRGQDDAEVQGQPHQEGEQRHGQVPGQEGHPHDAAGRAGVKNGQVIGRIGRFKNCSLSHIFLYEYKFIN